MGIKDNLEKAAAIFGAPSEPSCVLMAEDVKDKIINENPCGVTNRYALSYLEYAKSYLERKSVEVTGFNFDAFLNVLSVEFDAGIGRALININSHSKDDIEEIIDACIKYDKSFDITKHEFSDKTLEICEYKEDGWEEKLLCFAVDEFNDCGAFFKLNKGDVIAMAKALGATGEDLK